MECFTMNCKERKVCDRYKAAICLFRTTKEQFQLTNKIYKGNICSYCLSKLVRGRYKYSKNHIKLCTKCKSVEVRKRRKICI